MVPCIWPRSSFLRTAVAPPISHLSSAQVPAVDASLGRETFPARPVSPLPRHSGSFFLRIYEFGACVGTYSTYECTVDDVGRVSLHLSFRLTDDACIWQLPICQIHSRSEAHEYACARVLHCTPRATSYGR
jgi:hypothetical protein